MNASSLRILMTADGRPELWTYVTALVRALSAFDVEVLLAAMGPGLSPEQEREAAGLAHCRLCFRPLAGEWMQDPWGDVARAGDWLLELEEHFTPHAVHLNHYCHGSLPWTAPVVIAAHGCLLSAWQAVHGERAPHSWTRYHAEVAAGVRGANLLTASTKAMFGSLLGLYAPIPKLIHGTSGSRFPEFRPVPNGLDGARFAPGEKCEAVFAAGNPGEGALNLEMLDAVAGRLAWPVYAAGSGSPGALTWLRSPEEADELRARAAIFAAPSRYEPFGFEPLKAALAGCALVLGDLPCLRETWGEAALYAPADDAERFQAALEGLIGDAALRAEMAERARRQALQLTPERMAQGMIECYHALTAPAASPCAAAAM